MSTLLLRLNFSAQASALADVRAAVQHALARAGLNARLASPFVLAIDESCTNIIRHAYHGCESGRIGLRVMLHRGAVHVRLRDRAPAIDPGCIKLRDLDECRPGGLGIHIIAATMDHWQLRPLHSRRGNVLTMRRKLKARNPP